MGNHNKRTPLINRKFNLKLVIIFPTMSDDENTELYAPCFKHLLVRRPETKRGILIEITAPSSQNSKHCDHPRELISAIENKMLESKEKTGDVRTLILQSFGPVKQEEVRFFDVISNSWRFKNEIVDLLQNGTNVIVHGYAFDNITKAYSENAFGSKSTRLTSALSQFFLFYKGLPMPDAILHFDDTLKNIEADFTEQMSKLLKGGEPSKEQIDAEVINSKLFKVEDAKNTFAGLFDNVKTLENNKTSRDFYSACTVASTRFQREYEPIRFY